MKILFFFSILYLISCDIGQIGYFQNACPQGWQQFVNGRGRHIIGEGQYQGTHNDGSNDNKSFRAGDIGGQTSHRLTIEEMPNHNHNNGDFKYLLRHTCYQTTSRTDTSCGQPNIVQKRQLLSSGGNQFHNNLSPYIVLKGCKQIADKDKQQITKLQTDNVLLSEKIKSLESITNIVLTLVNQINTEKQKIESLQLKSTEQAQKLQNLNLVIQQNNSSFSQLKNDLQQKIQILNNSYSQLRKDLEQKIQTLNSPSAELAQQIDPFEKNCLDKFASTKGEFNVSVCIKRSKYQFILVIQLYKSAAKQLYQINIVQADIDQDSILALIYDTPAKIYDEMKSQFNKYEITEKGEIKYKILIHRKIKFIKFTTKMVTTWANSSLYLHLISNITILSNKINSLENQIQFMTNSNSSTSTNCSCQAINLQLSAINIKNTEIQTKISSTIDNKSTFDIKIRALQENSNILNESYVNLSAIAVNNSDKIRMINAKIQKINLVSQYSLIQNIDRFYYQVYLKSPNTLMIQRAISPNQHRPFVYIDPIKKNTTNTFKIKLIRSVVMIGIGTSDIFGKSQSNVYHNPQVVLFSPPNGNVYAEGTNVLKSNVYSQGAQIQMQVDTLNWLVTWNLNNTQIISYQIPNIMREKTIYLTLSSHNLGTTFELYL